MNRLHTNIFNKKICLLVSSSWFSLWYKEWKNNIQYCSGYHKYAADCYLYSLNLNQTKSTDYQSNLTDSNR